MIKFVRVSIYVIYQKNTAVFGLRFSENRVRLNYLKTTTPTQNAASKPTHSQ